MFFAVTLHASDFPTSADLTKQLDPVAPTFLVFGAGSSGSRKLT
jgi:hypothetical protein